jgi:hypothetical protein
MLARLGGQFGHGVPAVDAQQHGERRPGERDLGRRPGSRAWPSAAGSAHLLVQIGQPGYDAGRQEPVQRLGFFADLLRVAEQVVG